jgi:lactate dehydrogenase-like 2-hydroxyacid dehydrogenase
MKFRKILTIGVVEGTVDEEHWKKIDTLAEERVSLSKGSPDVMKHLRTTDCLLVNPFQMPIEKKHIDAAPSLKYIGAFSTAYGKIDYAYAETKGITVCNIPGFSTEAVAEFAFALILEHIRDIEHSKQLARQGDFSEVAKIPVYEIKGKSFGVIGLGRIGSRIAELAMAFGANVYYWSRTRKPDMENKGIKYQEISSLLSSCDFISINLALSKDTEVFMNGARINKIKHGAVFINLAPNELVDFDVLERRLVNNDIVYIADHTDEMNPEIVKRLSKYKGCILYPPLGFATKEAHVLKQDVFVGNVENFLKGKPTNKVN